MFVGHYGASLAIKSFAKEAPLGVLFLGAQLLDLLFFPLALAGIEQLHIVPHFTRSTHFELPYMPYTHSLLGALLWSLAGYVVAYLWFKKRVQKPAVVALGIFAVIFSHWVLDLVVHTPDMPLAGNDSIKLGFGLWNNAWATYAMEAIILLGGLWMYSRQANMIEKNRMTWFAAYLLIINIANVFGPLVTESVTVFAVMALASYLVFAAVAFWVERNRQPKTSPVHG